jgi:hypothetical protein
LQCGEQPAGDGRDRAAEQEHGHSNAGFEMPHASAATSASRIAVRTAEAASSDVHRHPGADRRRPKRK